MVIMVLLKDFLFSAILKGLLFRDYNILYFF